jgi:hypothetical protein
VELEGTDVVHQDIDAPGVTDHLVDDVLRAVRSSHVRHDWEHVEALR